MGATTRSRWQQLRDGLDEWRGIRRDEEVLDDVELDDPEQERFLERLDGVKLTLGRCALVGLPTWILVLALYPIVVPGGALGVGLGLATLLAVGVCVVFERWWRRRRPRRGAARAVPGRRMDPRTGALLAVVVVAVIAVYVIFVLAVSR